MEEHQQALRRGQNLLAVAESELEEERLEVAQLERAWRRYEKEVQEKSVTGRRDIQLDRHQVRPKGLDQCHVMANSLLFFLSKTLFYSVQDASSQTRR